MADLDATPSTLVEHEYSSYALNHHLLDRQDAWHNLDNLIKVHKEKLDIFQRMKNTTKINKKRLRKLAREVRDKEFELQRLWGFPEDINYHMFWDVPHCDCPSIDNRERWGRAESIISADCPIHGHVPNER